MFYIPFSLFSFWDSCQQAWCCPVNRLDNTLSYSPLNVFVCFCCSHWVISLPYLPDHWPSLLHHLISWWFLLAYFHFSYCIFFFLMDADLYFLSICWSFYCVDPFFSQVQWAPFMTFILISLSCKLLTSIAFSYFLRGLSFSFVWSIFLCFLILLNSLCLFLCMR